MKLRKYQVRINDATQKFIDSDLQRGQVYAPTGAGKTVCFTDLLKTMVDRGCRSMCVVHPRIALSKDQLKRLKRDLGTGVHFTSFHSGGKVSGQEAIGEIGTLDPDELKTVIDQTDRPHITFSSYQSYSKLIKEKVHFDLVICDEAHYLVADQYQTMLQGFLADKILFYTATPVTRDFEGGMLDESLFGPVIASVEPKELFKAGYIVAPIIHEMDCKTTKTSDVADIVDIVSRAWVDQYNRVTEWGMPYHQMLVSARNVEGDLTEIEDRLFEIKSYIEDNTDVRGVDVDIYTISSAGTFCNGRPIKERQDAIEQIKTSGRNAVVCHYDTLAEGIDIDTLSGCVIMRDMSIAKFIQTVGRVARAYKEDLAKNGAPRPSLYNPKKNIDKRKKPRSIVTIPTVDGVCIGTIDAVKIATAFIAGGYGDITTLMVTTDEPESFTGSVEFNISEDSVFMSHVLDHKIKEELAELNELLFGEEVA